MLMMTKGKGSHDLLISKQAKKDDMKLNSIQIVFKLNDFFVYPVHCKRLRYSTDETFH